MYHTHNGAVLLTNDNHTAIESESIKNILHPHGRFTAPITSGIPFYGFTPTTDEGAPWAPPPTGHHFSSDADIEKQLPPPPVGYIQITYPDLTFDQCPKGVRAVIARLHIN